MEITLTAEERQQLRGRVLAELTGTKAITLRPTQTVGSGPRVLFVGGRQSGKTFGASDWLAGRIAGSQDEYALVGPTFGQARDVMMEHPKSGLLVALARRGVTVVRRGRGEWMWNRSIGELLQGDRVAARIDGVDEGAERVQGHSIAAYWMDELRLMGDEQARHALDESLEYALSGSKLPQRVLTTATRATLLIRELMKDPKWDTRVLPMRENWDNLPTEYVEQMEEKRGTRLGRQELDGEMLEQSEGAFWNCEWIDDGRIDHAPPPRHTVISLDPSGGKGRSAQGFVIASLGLDGRAYVLRAEALRWSPLACLTHAIRLASEHTATLIIETNYGDQMMLALLEQAIAHGGRHVAYKTVAAKTGKIARAEQAAALYERGLVSHVGDLGDLEDQQLTFTGQPSDPSDLVDALGHALAELERFGVGRPVVDERDVGAIPWGADGAVEHPAVSWESSMEWTPGQFPPGP